MKLTRALNGDGDPIMYADVDGETVGHFKIIGKIGRHADLAFRYWRDGPQEVRFPMADMWPTERQAQAIVDKFC